MMFLTVIEKPINHKAEDKRNPLKDLQEQNRRKQILDKENQAKLVRGLKDDS